MKNLLLSLLFLFASYTSYTQTPHFIKHVLPGDYKSADVTTVFQSRSGFVWLGTTHGLLRYNGTSFKAFRPQDDSLEHVTSLFEDSSGALWIGHQSGKVSKLWQGKFQTLKDSLLATVPITGFAEDRENNLWVSTYGEGLVILSGDKVQRIQQKHGLSDDFIYCIVA